MHVKPVLLDCNFIVDAANGNGLGIRSLKGPCISAVYMHTSAPLVGSGNPNPPAGYILVKLQDNYNRYLGGFSGQVAPVSGTPLTSTTANNVQIIVSLGTATLAQWQARGLPLGVTPAVGVAFVASTSGTIGGSAAVEVIAAAGSGINHIEVVGDPNTTLANSAQPSNGGGYLIMACMSNSGGANAVAAPADGSVIGLSFYINDSSVLIGGE